MAACVQVSKVTKCYGATVAVGGLTLEVQTGEVFGLLGPNGAGKSTTLAMLTGLAPVTSGSISIFGRELRRNFVEIASRMGVLPERPAFYNHLSARQNLLMLAKLARRDVTVDRILGMVGLLEVQSRKVGAFSQGMRQRLGLAQALLTEPELLVLDEPAGGLDPEATEEIMRLLRRLADNSNVTVIVSSHMMHEVEVLCDRVAILNRGLLVSCERTESLLSYDQTNVEVLVDAPEGAARRLALADWVESVEVRARGQGAGPGGSSPGRLHVRLKAANAHQLAAHLIGAGFKVAGVIPRRRTLQDYFLKVMNK